MKVWALSDLHLSLAVGKPMDVFGDHWAAHHERMAEAWDAVVAPGDVVLTPGDFSWAMRANEVVADLAWLAERPGRKVLVKGNHDLWWPKSRTKLAALLPDGVHGLKKTAVVLEGDGARLGLFGCRGGDFKASPQYGDERTADDIEAWLVREERELEASWQHLLELEAGAPADLRICLFHYPPIAAGQTASRFTPRIVESGAEHCVYGHLHGANLGPIKVEGVLDGVRYTCASCDQLDFAPLLIAEVGRT